MQISQRGFISSDIVFADQKEQNPQSSFLYLSCSLPYTSDEKLVRKVDQFNKIRGLEMNRSPPVDPLG